MKRKSEILSWSSQKRIRLSNYCATSDFLKNTQYNSMLANLIFSENSKIIYPIPEQDMYSLTRNERNYDKIP